MSLPTAEQFEVERQRLAQEYAAKKAEHPDWTIRALDDFELDPGQTYPEPFIAVYPLKMTLFTVGFLIFLLVPVLVQRGFPPLHTFGVAAVIGGVLAFGLYFRRKSSPMLRLDREGIHELDFQRHIPWSSVVAIYMTRQPWGRQDMDLMFIHYHDVRFKEFTSTVEKTMFFGLPPDELARRFRYFRDRSATRP